MNPNKVFEKESFAYFQYRNEKDHYIHIDIHLDKDSGVLMHIGLSDGQGTIKHVDLNITSVNFLQQLFANLSFVRCNFPSLSEGNIQGHYIQE